MLAAFLEDEQIAFGEPADVQRELEEGYAMDLGAVRVFDDATGRIVDLNYWDVLRPNPSRGRGRPSLGVQAREVTLLPRHWDFLARQRGGASAALRRLVEEASRRDAGKDVLKDAAYNFMSATCGNRPGYEEALRALYREDDARFAELTARWPADIRSFIMQLRGKTTAGALSPTPQS
jgi:hypothetical protein